MAKQNDTMALETSPAPRSVLDATIDAARLADPLLEMPEGRTYAFVPDGYQLKDISDPDRLSPHVRQAVTVDDRASLTGYANRFSDERSIIIADLDAGTIRVALDWHRGNQGNDPLKAELARHSATLRLRSSEEFARWDAMEGEMHAQADFAVFIEENVSDVINPEQATLLEICRDLEATQDNAFKSGVRLENGDRTFKFEQDTRVKGEIHVPSEIALLIPIYHGEEPVELRAKFRFRATPQGLLLGFRWHRVEYQRQAIFRTMAFEASSDTGLPVFFGRT